MREQTIERVALLKLNIEGGEFELLEHLLDSGEIERFENIQVQFHWFAPEAHRRMQRIHEQLTVSHQTTYQYRFVWENWPASRLGVRATSRTAVADHRGPDASSFYTASFD